MPRSAPGRECRVTRTLGRDAVCVQGPEKGEVRVAEVSLRKLVRGEWTQRDRLCGQPQKLVAAQGSLHPSLSPAGKELEAHTRSTLTLTRNLPVSNLLATSVHPLASLETQHKNGSLSLRWLDPQPVPTAPVTHLGRPVPAAGSFHAGVKQSLRAPQLLPPAPEVGCAMSLHAAGWFSETGFCAAL